MFYEVCLPCGDSDLQLTDRLDSELPLLAALQAGRGGDVEEGGAALLYLHRVAPGLQFAAGRHHPGQPQQAGGQADGEQQQQSQQHCCTVTSDQPLRCTDNHWRTVFPDEENFLMTG